MELDQAMIGQAIGQKLLLAFGGKDKPSKEIIRAITEFRAGGITLFRSLNIDHPAQVRQLTEQLQRLAWELGLPPLLIATDQEGGQLMAVGEGTTQLPGNMALGATRSAELAYRAGEVLGCELAAMGLNVNYAPCMDVNLNPSNPVVGLRSFGENSGEVARLGCAMIQGIQSQGVAAVAKHFPGHGDTAVDSHHDLPVVPHSLERLSRVELPPFQASTQIDVKMVLTAHLALPALDGAEAPPATLSANIISNLLRRQLGFDGVIVTDAMDMHAIRQGEYLGEDAVRAVKAGVDLLLLTSDPQDQKRVFHALRQAVTNHALDINELQASTERILALKAWIADHIVTHDLNVVGCAEHQKVADEIAQGSITLVRDHANLLPLRLKADQKIIVVTPKPQDLTPADTSSYIIPALASSIRAFHPNVDEIITDYAPSVAEIAGVLQKIASYDLVILGTINAYTQPGQQTIVREALKTNTPVIVVALRLPYDLAAIPETPTYLCTYSILEPSMRALANSLFGRAAITGQLPVTIPGV